MDKRAVWPLQPGGGIFLICVGIGLVYGAILQGASIKLGLIAGFFSGALGIIIAIKASRKRFGPPSPRQRITLFAAIGFELLAFFILGRSGFFVHTLTLTIWVVVLFVVAVHFLIMRWSHGPLMLWLAIASMFWIGAAYLLALPPPVLIGGDGLLKVGFGIVMAGPLIRASSDRSASSQ